MDDQIIRLRARINETIVQLVWEGLVAGKSFDEAAESAKGKMRGYLAEFLNVPTERLIGQVIGEHLSGQREEIDPPIS